MLLCLPHWQRHCTQFLETTKLFSNFLVVALQMSGWFSLSLEASTASLHQCREFTVNNLFDAFSGALMKSLTAVTQPTFSSIITHFSVILNYQLPPAYAVEVMFSSCLCVCLTYWAITFEWVDIETSFFRMVLHLDHIQVKFEYQGHWIKAKVIWKMLILLPGSQFNLMWLVWPQGHFKVKL